MVTNTLTGQILKGYEILEQVGAGGFGAVYRAHQTLLKREVAVKVILPTHANKPYFIRRFEIEAELVARLEHPHIIPLYDYWRDPEGAFLVMRWLGGGSLRQLLDQERQLSIDEIVRVFDAVCSALSIAHRNRVVHRDIKPDNILLDADDNTYLADFGIARSEDFKTMSDHGGLGTIPYGAPEQFKEGEITPQTDIYALGVLLYELLAGVHPFGGSTASEMLFKHLHDPLPDITALVPDLPPEINMVIQRATAKEAPDRYEDARDLSTALKAIFAGSGTTVVTKSGALNTVDSYAQDVPTMAVSTGEVENPYKGLRAFLESDADDFFGRENLVNLLLERMGEDAAEARFLAVVGPSGSGKSSVVKAGLIPALRNNAIPGAENWFFTEMFPGSHPFAELEAALLRVAVNPPDSLIAQLQEENGLLRALKRVLPPDDETELLLVIDQFEELFTQAEDDDKRIRFLDNLVEAITDRRSRLRVVVTLRADFYDRPLQYRQFGELLRQRMETVLPLAPAELEAAIARPAEQVGIYLENGLVNAISSDVGEQPGTLPLLQYALTELFERREGRMLTLHAYKEIGGVVGALAKRADEIYTGLDEPGKEASRQLFLRLVTLGEGTEDTRRRIRMEEVITLGDAMQRVIDIYGGSRLLTFDRDPMTRTPTIEVAHEALIRSWQQLRDWLDESRDVVRLQRRLYTAAVEWEESGRSPGFLARDSRLEQFEMLLEAQDVVLNPTEQAYLDAALEVQKAEVVREQRRQQTQRLTVVGSIVLIAIIALAILQSFNNFNLSQVNTQLSTALDEVQARGTESQSNAQLAATNEAIANQQLDIVRQLSLAANSQVALSNFNRDVAIALGLTAVEGAADDKSVRAETERALASAAYAPGTRLIFEGHTAPVRAIALSPNSLVAYSGSDDGQLLIWNVLTGAILQEIPAHISAIRDIDLNPDGTLVATGADDGIVRLWNTSSGQAVATFQAHVDAVTTLAFSPDGAQLLTGGEEGIMKLWDIETGRELLEIDEHEGAVLEVAFHPTRPLALSMAFETDPQLWDLETGELVLDVEAQRSFGTNFDVSAAAFSADGTQVIASYELGLSLWDIETGETIQNFSGHGSYVNSVSFSPDERFALSSARRENSVRLWDIGNGQEISRFEGHEGIIQDVAISFDGRYAVSAADDNTVRVWELVSGALIDSYIGSENDIFSVDYASDGETVIASGVDPNIYRLDVETGEIVQTYEGHEERVWIIKFNADDSRIFSAGDENAVFVWDAETGELLNRLEGHTSIVTTLDISPDGLTLASGSSDATVRLWDIETGETRTILDEIDGALRAVQFSPDGSQLLIGSDNARLIDLETGEVMHILEGHTDRVNTVAFNRAGNRFVTGSGDGTMRLWDAETGGSLQFFEGHTGQVRSVVFTHDDRQILSSSADTTLRLWDANTGLEVRRLDGHTEWVNQAVLSPDGRMAVSGAWDETVRLWHIHSLDGLVEWTLDNRYVRELTCDEQVQYDVVSTCG